MSVNMLPKMVEKVNKTRGTIILILFLILTFYWIFIRPAQVRHECSWVHIYQDLPSVSVCTNGFLTTPEWLACHEGKTQDYWTKATPKEYEFCLHDKGL